MSFVLIHAGIVKKRLYLHDLFRSIPPFAFAARVARLRVFRDSGSFALVSSLSSGHCVVAWRSSPLSRSFASLHFGDQRDRFHTISHARSIVPAREHALFPVERAGTMAGIRLHVRRSPLRSFTGSFRSPSFRVLFTFVGVGVRAGRFDPFHLISFPSSRLTRPLAMPQESYY